MLWLSFLYQMFLNLECHVRFFFNEKNSISRASYSFRMNNRLSKELLIFEIKNKVVSQFFPCLKCNNNAEWWELECKYSSKIAYCIYKEFNLRQNSWFILFQFKVTFRSVEPRVIKQYWFIEGILQLFCKTYVL